MKGPRKDDRRSPVADDRGVNPPESQRPARPEVDPTSGFEAAMDGGAVDLRPVVQFLASRVWDAERQIARLARRVDGMKRRIKELETQLAGVESRSFRHDESIRIMSVVLKELDDPYDFGPSLDERPASDEADLTTDDEA